MEVKILMFTTGSYVSNALVKVGDYFLIMVNFLVIFYYKPVIKPHLVGFINDEIFAYFFSFPFKSFGIDCEAGDLFGTKKVRGDEYKAVKLKVKKV